MNTEDNDHRMLYETLFNDESGNSRISSKRTREERLFVSTKLLIGRRKERGL